MAVAPKTNLQRFERWFFPNPLTGCWIWLGARHVFGYGKFGYRLGTADYRLMDAHRVAWLLYRGEIPQGLCVCHRCDVPQCVNPAHLFLGTKKENIQDARAKGRPIGDDRGLWTHCKNGHPLTPDNLVKHMKQRRCRICASAYARAYSKTPKGQQFAAEYSARRRAANNVG